MIASNVRRARFDERPEIDQIIAWPTLLKGESTFHEESFKEGVTKLELGNEITLPKSHLTAFYAHQMASLEDPALKVRLEKEWGASVNRHPS